MQTIIVCKSGIARILTSVLGASLVYDVWAYSRSLFAGEKPLFLYEKHLKKN